MYRESKSNKIISIVLSVLMVVTMFPVMAITSVAETNTGDDTGFTKPVKTSGGWEHELDKGYTDGRGTHFVSLNIDKTEFTFIQTKDNQKFNFSYIFSAMKNDGVNYAIITNIVDYIDPTVENPFIASSKAWSARKDLNSKNSSETPNGAALPGYLSQGYKVQKTSNIMYWQHDYYFTGAGAKEYISNVKVDYTSGPYIMNTEDVNNYSTINEPVDLVVKVIDERELINAVAEAQELIATGNAPAGLQAIVDEAIANHMTDGTVFYSQDEIDAQVNAINSQIPADYSDYINALRQANEILAKEGYPETVKDVIRDEINNKYPQNEVLGTLADNQAYVDEAAASLAEIIANVSGEGVDAPNTIPVSSTATSKSWVVNPKDVSKAGVSRWTASTPGAATVITISNTDIYMDVTEDLGKFNIEWSAYSDYPQSSGYYRNMYKCAGPLSEDALNATAAGADVFNYDNYITGYTNANAKDSLLIAKNKELVVSGTDGSETDRNTKQIGDVFLDGTLKNAQSLVKDEPTYIIPGYKVQLLRKGSVAIWSNVYQYNTEDSKEYDQPYEIIGTGTSARLDTKVSYPGFNLHVYDKTPLMNAINDALALEYNGSTNWSEFINSIIDAKTVYNKREVNQSEVLAATNALNDFKFEYKTTFGSNYDTEDIDIVMTNLNGKEIDPESVAGKSVNLNTATIEAVSNSVDYTFVKWSDGDTNPVKTIVAGEASEITAEFKFNTADYTALEEALALIPEDLTMYKAETVAELQKAVANITYDLPLSQQATVDAYTQAILDAINSLEIAPADYSQLDVAIQAAKDIPLDYIENNAAKDDLVRVLKNAENVDRDLDTTDQEIIDTLTEQLLFALNNITVLPADYSKLQEALANAGLENPESYYSEASIEEYNRALATAQEVMATKGTEDEYNKLGQYIIDKAAQDLIDALAGLTPNGECYYGALDKAIKEAAELDTADFTPETLAAFTEALAAAQAIERNMIDDSDGINQAIIDAAAQNLINATNALEFSPADYTELDRQLAITPEFDETTASAESWADYQKALKDAEEISRNLTVLDQDYIDAVANALKDARENIAPLGECYYGDLNEQIAKAEALNEDDFTAESWEAIQTALTNANAIEKGLINDAEGVNQTAIDNATTALKDAIKNAVEMIDVTITNNGEVVDTIKVEPGTTVDEAGILDAINDSLSENEAVIGVYYGDGTPVNPDDEVKYDFTADVHTVDTTDANDAINDANDAINSGAYDEDSMKALQDAIDAIEAFLDPDTIHPATDNQETLDKLVEALQDVIDNLVPDKSGLEGLIKDAEAIDQDKYTDETAKDLQDAITAAKDVLDDEDATVEEIKEALENLQDAIDNLVPDKSGLEDLIKDAKDTDTTGKTDSSADALEDAIADAEDVIGNPDATPEEIEEAIKALEDAIAGLEDKADYTDEEAAYDKANDIDTSKLSDEAKKALEDAIAAADELDKDLPATEQGTVDAVTDALIDAIVAAEKETLADKIKEAEDTDTTGMSDESVKALEDAINDAKDVLADEDATPEEIENAIKDLQDAIDGLTDEITITVVDENGDVITEITDKVGMTMDEIAEDLKDTIPQDKDGKDLVGYVDENGDLIPDNKVITGSETIKPVYEFTKITPKDETTIGIERRDDLDGTDGLIDGFTLGANSVDEIKALLENDEIEISVVNFNGDDLAGTDLVGTGSVIIYKSKLTGKVYERLTVIIYGDVDGDGEITKEDGNTIKRVAKIQEKMTNVYFIMAADCDGDNSVDGLDATYVSSSVKGKSTIDQARLFLR